MCGFVGFINCGTREELNKAVSVISHRGPDNQNFKWFDQNKSGLGHARLSIIDLSPNGNQPMYDLESKKWIVFNGEIFNYQEIKKKLLSKGYNFITDSDTEVIFKSFQEWGTNCLEHFNGMFAFAIYDENEQSVFAARDRLGIKPFYYYLDGNKLIFGSEIKSLLEYKSYHKEPDYYSLHTPVHFQVGPYTGFKNILKLPAGNYFLFKNGSFEMFNYWDIQPIETKMPYQEAFNELDYLLQDSINLQMISDVPIGSLLSGGLDSSIISVLMQKKMTQPLNTFTIKFKQEDLKRQGNVDDSYYAKKLASQFGFNHHEIEINPNIVDLLPKLIWHLDEPIADPASINTYLISKAAKEANITVLLSGMGADEVFSGYRSHLACIKADTYQKIPSLFRKTFEAIINNIPESNNKRNFKYIRWAKQFIRIASLTQLNRALVVKNSALTQADFAQYFAQQYNYLDSCFIKTETDLFNKFPSLNYLTKLCYIDSKNYLTNHNLTYSDKSMMAAGIEGRPPLIDHRIVELMFKLPPDFRINKNVQKFLLKKVSEKYLPREIIYRPKAPFSAPLRGWLKNELAEYVQDILSFDRIKNRGMYNPNFVQKLIEDNKTGKTDNSQLIWRLMVNEIWFKTFFDK